MKPQGFTLIELLLGMALLGVLLVLILDLQSSTISFTTRQSNAAQRLQAINDVAGYIGDRVRAAQSVPDGLIIAGDLCSRSGAQPCLAVILPVVETRPEPSCGRQPGTVTGWALHAYRYLPRSSLSAAETSPLPGLELAAYALQDVRVAATGPAGVCPPRLDTVPTSFSGPVSKALLADNLMLPDEGTPAFAYSPITRTLTLRLRSVSRTNAGGMEYTPSRGVYVLSVFARNVD